MINLTEEECNFIDNLMDIAIKHSNIEFTDDEYKLMDRISVKLRGSEYEK